MAELDVGARTRGSEPLCELCGFALGSAEVSRDSVETNEEAARPVVVRVLAQALGEERSRLVVAPAVDEQDRLAVELGSAGRAAEQRDESGEDRREHRESPEQ